MTEYRYYHAHEDRLFEEEEGLCRSMAEHLEQHVELEGPLVDFPETLCFWREGGDGGFELGAIPAADEAGCGADPAAWDRTLLAYRRGQICWSQSD